MQVEIKDEVVVVHLVLCRLVGKVNYSDLVSLFDFLRALSWLFIS
jgi:hypothetical protein